jgi:hypothetical protein
MAFYVGQKVVCVDDITCWGPPSEMDGLTKGRVYTIREFARHQTAGEFGVRLVEIVRPLRWDDIIEQPFILRRFRPVVERKTDISIFTEMLDPSKHKKLEGV